MKIKLKSDAGRGIESKLDVLLKNRTRHQAKSVIRYPELKAYKKELLEALIKFHGKYSFYKADIFKKLANEVSTSVKDSVHSVKALNEFISKASANSELKSISISVKTKQGKRSFEISNQYVANILIDAMMKDERINYAAFNQRSNKTGEKNSAYNLKTEFIRVLYDFIKDESEYKGTKKYSNKQCKVIAALLYCVGIDETYNSVYYTLTKQDKQKA
jgi:hypothetical protein